ncbi:Di-sulfide bridge nucleocytoplasmic transport domain-containing protein [Lipomyces arxii]|uniref:Di-sulfide bridge nucleocytoplasmic transport domain-containing protein n=1 Tax=Lipomyces arxii TaxID=56418 RepID=UPI0034CE6323
MMRGQESPMDFQYDSVGPVPTESPFLQAVNTQHLQGRYNGPGSYVPEQTPFVTPRTSFKINAAPSSRFYSNVYESPSYGRGASIDTPVVIDGNGDNDVEMMMESSPMTPSPNKENFIDLDSSTKENVDPRKTSSRRFRGKDDSPAASSPVGQFMKSCKKLLPRKSPRKQKKQKQYIQENSDSEEDNSDYSGSEQSWSGKKMIVRETIMLSPRKGSSSRINSSRKVSRSISEGNNQLATIQQSNGSLLTFLSHHDNLPYVFASYLQLVFNVFLVLVMFYLIFSFVLMIRHDIARKVEESVAEAEAIIAQCGKNYMLNRCGDLRLPAFEAQCAEWKTCMNSDSNAVGRASIGAETIAGIVNSFIEPISYKTMMFVLCLIFGSLYVSSSKATPHLPPQHMIQNQQSQVKERALFRSKSENLNDKGALVPIS